MRGAIESIGTILEYWTRLNSIKMDSGRSGSNLPKTNDGTRREYI